MFKFVVSITSVLCDTYFQDDWTSAMLKRTEWGTSGGIIIENYLHDKYFTKRIVWEIPIEPKNLYFGQFITFEYLILSNEFVSGLGNSLEHQAVDNFFLWPEKKSNN